MTFDEDTRVERVGDRAYAVTLSDRWNALGGVPNGGYLLAVALRALAAEMPLPDPIVASATYLRPGAPGPAEIATEVVRAGRRVATGEARLSQESREIIRVLATFADLDAAGGRTLVRSAPPALPAVEETREYRGELPGVTIIDRFEYRSPHPPGWANGTPTGEADVAFWLRFRDGRDADPIALAAMVDAAAPAVLELGEPGSATIELTVHIRGRPAPGWLACRALTRHVIGGYHEEDFEIWDSAGALVAQSRQFALLTG
jgi:acyl-coenzyme A thioesterase PaaI-like protein